MGDAILVLNAGSSSLKFALFEAGGATAGEDPELMLRGQPADTVPRPCQLYASPSVPPMITCGLKNSTPSIIGGIKATPPPIAFG